MPPYCACSQGRNISLWPISAKILRLHIFFYMSWSLPSRVGFSSVPLAALFAGLAVAVWLPASWLLLSAALVCCAGGAVIARVRAAAGRRCVAEFCRSAGELRRAGLRCCRLLQESHLMARGVTLWVHLHRAASRHGVSQGVTFGSCTSLNRTMNVSNRTNVFNNERWKCGTQFKILTEIWKWYA